MRPIPPAHSLWVPLALLLLATAPARADFGAVTSGNWNTPAIWTGGTVPGTSDRVFIGSTSPAGSATTATVTLTQNQSANVVYLGYGNGTAGTLNLGTSQLTVGTLFLGYPGLNGVGTIQRGAGGRFTADSAFVFGSGSSLTFGAGDAVSFFQVGEGGTAFTTAAGNPFLNADQIDLRGGGTLTLGSSLVSSSVNIFVRGGTLAAAGNPISTNAITLSDNWTLTGQGNLAPFGMSVRSQAFTFQPGDTAKQLFVSGIDTVGQASTAAVVTTAATGNLTGNVIVYGPINGGGAGSLTLGAPLTLVRNDSIGIAGQLSVIGGATLNAQNYPITVNSLSIGGTGQGGPLPAVLQNLGAITTTGGTVGLGNGAQVPLSPGSSARLVTLLGGSILTIRSPAGQPAQLTVTNTAATALAIDATSKLRFDLNGLAPGYVLRWANPTGGDHLSELSALIAGGKIDFVPLNGGTYQLTTDATYTYIFQPVPEPTTVFGVGAAALGVGAFVRRRGQRG
jgi:hypothetical protein